MVKKQDDIEIDRHYEPAKPSQISYSWEDTEANWGETYRYEIIAYYPESDCKNSSVTIDAWDEITLGESTCEGRYDHKSDEFNCLKNGKICYHGKCVRPETAGEDIARLGREVKEGCKEVEECDEETGP